MVETTHVASLPQYLNRPEARAQTSPAISRTSVRARSTGSNWTVKDGARNPRRPVRSPNVVWPVTAAPLPKGMGDIDEETNPFAKEQAQLREMWRHSSMNRYYLPISKMPPLGPDPRLEFGRRPPACCPDRSISRINRIVDRWNSMPQLRCQLPLEDLDEILSRDDTAQEQLQRVPEQRHQATESPPAVDEARCRHGRRAKKSLCVEARDFPHVRCSCCDHPEPKPWQQKRTLGAVSRRLWRRLLEGARLRLHWQARHRWLVHVRWRPARRRRGGRFRMTQLVP
eukprot:CAMPEP_0115580976 /NCGR_PEP_ID=MMETSP0272-20121206/4911_1 /TAXON_ID=71861 /ORGANISM="Scrippsiella trochoidea, Strain CCMP3099" /LENGTH=283 /DNA_ID=CAMNT_0003015927 /DNA_START=54 /DNA_END=901 /DNA_ORIENTATION=+